MMKIAISISALAVVSLADCNGVWLGDYAVFPWDVCDVAGTASYKYVCGNGDTGFMLSWSTSDDCSGTPDTNSSFESSGGDVYTAKCSETTDCDYITYSGYIKDDATCGQLFANGTEVGTYYAESYVFTCSEGTDASYKWSCNDDGNRVWKRYSSGSCSSDDVVTSTVLETCLTTLSGQCESDYSDDVMQMTVKAVFLIVMASILV